MTRQERALWFIKCLRILATGIAASAIAAVIYHGLRSLLPDKEDKLTEKQMRRRARKAAKANRSPDVMRGRR